MGCQPQPDFSGTEGRRFAADLLDRIRTQVCIFELRERRIFGKACSRFGQWRRGRGFIFDLEFVWHLRVAGLTPSG